MYTGGMMGDTVGGVVGGALGGTLDGAMHDATRDTKHGLIRVLIVDDEQPARDKLRRQLGQTRFGERLLIDDAADGVEALARIAVQRPDIVFLDIQMPETSGLEVAASLPAPAPLVVFVTAYDQYAVRAFDANAIDYLLKPYDLPRLQRALERVMLRLEGPPTAVPVAGVGAAAPAPSGASLAPAPAPRVPAPTPHRLPLHHLLVGERGVTRVVRIVHIGWIETADNYVVLHCLDAQPLLRQSLAALLDQLGPAFMRCHRRAAVQLSWIERLIHHDKGDAKLLLRGGARVPCSRQYRAAVLARLAQLAAGGGAGAGAGAGAGGSDRAAAGDGPTCADHEGPSA